MEKKTFSKFKRLVDSVYDTKQFYEKQEKMQEEISDLKNSKTTVGNFLGLIRDIDVEIGKLSQNDNVNDVEFKSSLEDILRAMYDRSNIFCVEDSHASKFEVTIYYWSEELNKLIFSRHANKNMNHTYRSWNPFNKEEDGCTGMAFRNRSCVYEPDLPNSLFSKTVKNRPPSYDENYISVLSCPIMLPNEKPLGTITVSCNIVNRFTKLHEDKLLPIIAIRIHRLLEFVQAKDINISILSLDDKNEQ